MKRTKGKAGLYVLRFIGYFLGYTLCWGMMQLLFKLFPATQDLNLIPPAVVHFLKWPFYMTLMSAVAFPAIKEMYGGIAEDISDRAALKVSHFERFPEQRNEASRAVENTNWDLGMAGDIFPGNIE